MRWKCIDAAKELILKNSLENIMVSIRGDRKVVLTAVFLKNGQSMFLHALQDNLPAFVFEFLKLGIKPAKIFFVDHHYRRPVTNLYKTFLETMYTVPAGVRMISSFSTRRLSSLVFQSTKHLATFSSFKIEANKESRRQGNTDAETQIRELVNIDALNKILHELIGDYMDRLYSYSDQVRGSAGKSVHESLVDLEIRRSLPAPNELTDDDYIMRDLFLWAIIINFVDMAKVLLANMKYRICPALIATKILKYFHEKAAYGELKDTFMQSADFFERYAIDCVDRCEKNDPDMACELVLQQNELYGKVTCLQVRATRVSLLKVMLEFERWPMLRTVKRSLPRRAVSKRWRISGTTKFNRMRRQRLILWPWRSAWPRSVFWLHLHSNSGTIRLELQSRIPYGQQEPLVVYSTCLGEQIGRTQAIVSIQSLNEIPV